MFACLGNCPSIYTCIYIPGPTYTRVERHAMHVHSFHFVFRMMVEHRLLVNKWRIRNISPRALRSLCAVPSLKVHCTIYHKRLLIAWSLCTAQYGWIFSVAHCTEPNEWVLLASNSAHRAIFLYSRQCHWQRSERSRALHRLRRTAQYNFYLRRSY